jgi:hypothetical protein
MRRVNTLAIHLGADALAGPGHAHLCVLRSCRDTQARMTRLAHAAGIQLIFRTPRMVIHGIS